MSITFSIVGEKSHCDSDDYCDACHAQSVNMSNVNAWAMMNWLGMQPADYGQIPGRALAALCRKALSTQPFDPGVPATTRVTPGFATVINGGRRAGYMQERAQELLDLALRAGELGVICWG